jgi:UDP-glucose 4-epimerase
VEILITGGAGWIGSTVAWACRDAGIEPVILDNLRTGRRELAAAFPLYVGDIADRELLERVMHEHPGIAVIVHCAASTSVPESTEQPLEYWANNVAGTVNLLRNAVDLGVTRVVFSSTAAIYAPSDDGSVSESSQLAPSSPYARTKAAVEQVLVDAAAAGTLKALSLRYFNPVGADPQLRTGQSVAEPSHVLGRILSAHRSGGRFTITGTDWPTRDGTGLRDYVHVWDLALAHVAALQRFDTVVAPDGHRVLNLGSGKGTTVRELVTAVEAAAGPFDVVDGPRRAGDVAGAWARCDRAKDLLAWTPTLDLEQGVADALRWDVRRREILGS